MNDKTYLQVSGLIFGLIAIGQLTRLILQLPVQVGMWQVPLWASGVAVVLAFVLCVWAFRIARTR